MYLNLDYYDKNGNVIVKDEEYNILEGNYKINNVDVEIKDKTIYYNYKNGTKDPEKFNIVDINDKYIVLDNNYKYIFDKSKKEFITQQY